jgi:hypothetical protein
MVVGLERGRQVCHLKQDDPERPDVTLLVVALLIALLRTHVERGANVCLCELALPFYAFGKTKVTQLDVLPVIEKNVGRLQVPMKY